MERNSKPRHIRDIAHLYLSRLPEKRNGRHSLLYIAASSVDCFGAYHAANIALCLQQRGQRVRLIDLSGNLPCCAYFLKLPPRVYIKQKKENPGEELSALAGISVCFEAPGSHAAKPGGEEGIVAGFRPRAGSQIDIVHLPPASASDAAEAALRSCESLPGVRNATAAVLAPDDRTAQMAGGRLFGSRSGIDWVTLALSRKPRAEEHEGSFRQSLGYLAGWRPLLSDPLPCVVRDPESHLSRSYFSVSEALISRSNRPGDNHAVSKSQRTKPAGRFR
jgi:hypothetical protein